MAQFSFNGSLFGSRRQDTPIPPSFGSPSTPPPSPFTSSDNSPPESISQQDIPSVSVNNTDTVTDKEVLGKVEDYLNNKYTSYFGNYNKIQTITHENLLSLATEYHKKAKNKQSDIVDTIISMIGSSQYVFSERFKTKKMNLSEMQLKFRMLTQPETISRDEVIAELFNV